MICGQFKEHKRERAGWATVRLGEHCSFPRVAVHSCNVHTCNGDVHNCTCKCTIAMYTSLHGWHVAKHTVLHKCTHAMVHTIIHRRHAKHTVVTVMCTIAKHTVVMCTQAMVHTIIHI